ncbi:putative serine/threonine protein kinase IREH1 [Forsythia ovata]|uniref:Serine/threonine protein kinase IREH1 n=1 Tax=Forsythia ovata TaxID=205694 RepID=A0ABD1WYH6_9LAMI
MVFKGRFFSSKKSDASSPDGSSNSPRSFGSKSNSPIRSDKKKPKSSSPSISKDNSPSTPTGSTSKNTLKKKESKGKEAHIFTKPSSGISSSFAPSKLKKPEEAAVPVPGPGPTSVSVSPIVASSLGLNKIKTRSGPLPQESFFSFNNREKGKEKSLVENADNGSNSDGLSTESGRSWDQSPNVVKAQARSRLQNGESSSGAAAFSEIVQIVNFPCGSQHTLQTILPSSY